MSMFDYLKKRFNFKQDENDLLVAKRRNLLIIKFAHLIDYEVITSREQLPDKFVSSDKVGVGSFGTVYRVTLDQKETEEYALKRIPMDGIEAEDKQVLKEIQAMKIMKHQNIVNFHYYCIEFNPLGGFFLNLIMEFCPQNLFIWLDDNPMRNHVEVMFMFEQICHGLKHIHSMNYIHRDLKPANILIDYQGMCKIADFGISTLHTTRAQSVTNYYHTVGVGPPLYSAPEQILGIKESSKKVQKYDYKVDIYSMGCILVDFLVNYERIEDRTRALLDIRDHHKLPMILNIQSKYERVSRLIKRMTEKEPSKRPIIEEVIKCIRGIPDFKFQRQWSISPRNSLSVIELTSYNQPCSLKLRQYKFDYKIRSTIDSEIDLYSPSTPFAYANEEKIAICMRDYEAQNENELSFRDGEKLLIIEDGHSMKYLAKHMWTKEKGFVHKHHVTLETKNWENWFFGKISYEVAEKLLLLSHNPIGTFLVRNSKQTPGTYVLSVKYYDNDSRKYHVKRYKAKTTNEGRYRANFYMFSFASKSLKYQNETFLQESMAIWIKFSANKKIQYYVYDFYQTH